MNKIPYLDPLRSILMLFGVVIHSAQVYSPHKTWLITSETPVYFTWYIAEILHLFRMPAFFIISGFLLVVSIKKYPIITFFKKRLIRIILPLFVIASSLNFLQYLFLFKIDWSFRNYLLYWQSDFWLSHLWFLVNLICYFSIFGLLGWLLKTKQWNLNFSLPQIPFPFLIALLPFIHLCILFLNKLGIPIYSSIFGVSVYMVLEYLPFFTFGLLIAINRGIYQKFITINLFQGCLVLVIVTLFYYLFSEQFDKYILMEALFVYLKYLSMWVLSSLCFTCFSKMYKSSAPIWNYLANSAYSIYLFHHILVIMLGSYFIFIGIPAIIGVLLLMVLVTLISVVLHSLLVDSNWLGKFLLNGKL